MDKYTKQEVSKILQMPIARFREWLVKYIEPEIPDPGKGFIAYYTYTDLVRILVFELCMRAEISRKTAGNIVMKMDRVKKNVHFHSLNDGLLLTIDLKKIMEEISEGLKNVNVS